MKQFKKLFAIVLALVLSLSLVACGDKTNGEEGAWEWETEAEVLAGVTEDTIWVGNTAGTTGALSTIGGPFNYGIQAAFNAYNLKGGFNGKKVALKHYDDGGNPAESATLTGKLIHEDEVFAIVGHFGSNTVAATVDYIEEQGIPMVYGVCGVSELYDTERNIMTVQPIYDTEGRSMLASALAPVEAGGLGGTKVGVIYTTDDAGFGMVNGIREEEKALGVSVVYQSTGANATDDAAQVAALKAAGCDVVIIAANQAPFVRIAGSFISQGYDNVKIITSYVSANASAMGGLVLSGVITPTREVYAGAWLVTGALPSETKGWQDYVEYVRIMTLYAKHKGEALLTTEDATYGAYLPLMFPTEEWAQEGVSAYFLNSYAMAGYVSANVFCQGLSRMSGKDLNWEDFIAAMEEAPINVPMGTAVSYVGGQRIGIDALALNKYTVANFGVGEVYRGITGLGELEAAIRG